MAEEPTDFDRTHQAFLEQRMGEVQSEVNDALKTLGHAFGVENLRLDDVTLEAFQQSLRAVFARFRRGGHLAFADRYLAAFTQAHVTMQAHMRFLVFQEERELTDAERVQADAVEAAADEAYEYFERVQAEAGPYFSRWALIQQAPPRI